MSAKSKTHEKRQGGRRQKDDRRDNIRWEPSKSARRDSSGRRRSDLWDAGKKS